MGLKVKDLNGEWKETGGALKVIKVDDKKECEHEVYNLSTETRFSARLKPKIDKPTEAQIAEFASGVNIVFQSPDTENLRNIVSVDYGLRISADTIIPCIYFRDEAIRVNWYYIWEDEVAIVKAFLEQMGLDASALTTEGWYSAADAVVKVTEEEVLDRDFEKLIGFYVRPYGDYFYSLFDFYRNGNNETADQILVYRNVNDFPFVMAAQEKLCKKDIINITMDRAFTTVLDKNGFDVDGYERIKEYHLFGTIQVDLITTLDISGIYCQYTQYAFDHAGNMYQISRGCSSGEQIHFNKDLTYGFAISVSAQNASHSNPKITDVYANATIVSHSESEVYISGLRHDTHIVVMVEQAE